jgi:hypothetical protein
MKTWQNIRLPVYPNNFDLCVPNIDTDIEEGGKQYPLFYFKKLYKALKIAGFLITQIILLPVTDVRLVTNPFKIN